MKQHIMKSNRFLLILVAAIAPLLLHGCYSIPVRDWEAMEGVVLDAQTNEPIEGAIVIAHWEGTDRYSTTQCFHSEIAITDENGRYLIPAWRNTGRSASAFIEQIRFIKRAYKYGYDQSPHGETEAANRRITRLEPSKVNGKARISYLSHLAPKISCGNDRDSRENVIPVFKLLHREASALGGDGTNSDGFRTIIFYMALAISDMSTTPSDEEARGIVSDYLRE